MTDFSVRTKISAQADKVWGQLTNFDAWNQWNTTHTGFPNGASPPLVPGVSFQEGMRLMGYPAEITWSVEELEPSHLLSLSGKGPAGVRLRQVYRLVSTRDDGTELTVENSVTGAAVTLLASKVREPGTSALNESLSRLALLVK